LKRHSLSLSESETRRIDDALLAATSDQWRKSARVIGSVMTELGAEFKGVPDTFYFERIIKLVEEGTLIAQGSLSEMRLSEIRITSSAET